MTSEVLLAEPRGFCAGVDRAIDIVEHALAKFGRPIYVRHEIVHNTYVVNDLKDKGAIFIEELSEVPPGATLIFSAHGVSLAVQQEAERRGFRIFDATCPLVTKVHVEVAKLHKEGYEFIMIGHKGHPEVEGTMGQLDSGIHLVEDVADVATLQLPQTDKIAVVTQTTLSVDDAAEITAAVPGIVEHVAPRRRLHDRPTARASRYGARGTRADAVRGRFAHHHERRAHPRLEGPAIEPRQHSDCVHLQDPVRDQSGNDGLRDEFRLAVRHLPAREHADSERARKHGRARAVRHEHHQRRLVPLHGMGRELLDRLE